jgi:transposase-like protein
MFTLTISLPNESWCSNLLRNVRWRKGNVVCPRCHSYDTKKDGQYRFYQKYFCKQCERWFNDKTGTVFHYSHTQLKKWFLTLYLYFVLWPGCSIKEISSEVAVPYPRCYRFIRTVMEKLSSSPSLSTTKLGGITECDEFYIKAGLKGRSYHDEIVKTGRKIRRRGLKPWRGRGTFDKDQPMITCFHQRNGLTYFDVPVKKSLLDTVCNRVRYGSTVFTDEYRGYDPLEEHGFIHKSVKHSEKEYVNGTIHVNNCECRSNLYQLWIRKFMGVNKHNLQTYSKTFQFIHNNRTKTREERFKGILYN